MDRFVRRMIAIIFFSAVTIGAIVAIWEAIPGVIKIIVLIVLIGGFVKMMKSK